MLTGPDGEFSFSGVKVPYDLTVIWRLRNSPTIPRVMELHGLTRQDPVIFVNGNTFWSTYIQGHVSGPTFPIDGSVCLALRGAPSTRCAGPYNFADFRSELTWLGGDPTDPALVGVVTERLRNGGMAWGLAGKQDPFDVRVDADAVDLVLDQTVPTAETTLRYTLGAYTWNLSGGIETFQVMGAKYYSSPDAYEWELGSTFEFPLEGGTLRLSAYDADGGWASINATAQLGGVTEIHFPETAPLRRISPAKDATGLSTTPTFSWTAVPGAKAYWLNVGRDGGSTFSFGLPPSTTSFQMPAYEPIEVGLGKDHKYYWTIQAYVDSSMDVDGTTDGTGLRYWRLVYGGGTVHYSSTGWFETAP